MCARDRVRTYGPFAPPAFSVVLLFVGIIIVPAAFYLYLAHPGWTWMYLVDPDRMPGLALLPLLVLHGGMVIVGWYVGARLIRADKAQIALYAALGSAALVMLLALMLWGRLGSYGTYAAFVDKRALPIMEVKLGYVLIALMLGTAVAASFVGLELTRDSRRVRAR